MKKPAFVVPGQEAFRALLVDGSANKASAGRCGGSGRCPSPKSAPRRVKSRAG